MICPKRKTKNKPEEEKRRYHEPGKSTDRLIMEQGMKYRHIIFDLEGTLVEPDFSVSAFLGNLSGQFASCAGVRPLVQGLKSAGFTLGAISTYD